MPPGRKASKLELEERFSPCEEPWAQLGFSIFFPNCLKSSLCANLWTFPLSRTDCTSQPGNRKFCLKRSDNFQQEKTLEFFRYLLIDKSTRQSLEKINTGSKSIIQTQTYQVSPLKSPLFSLCHKNKLTNTQYIYNFYLCSLTLTSLHRISPRVSVITFHNLEKRFITNSGITRW